MWTPSVLDVLVLEFLHPDESPQALNVLTTPHQDIESWRWSPKRQVRSTGDYDADEIRIDGELHSLTEPARKWADSSECWYAKGLRHRDGDLPAVVRANGEKQWWQEGRPYRANGLPYWVDGDSRILPRPG